MVNDKETINRVELANLPHDELVDITLLFMQKATRLEKELKEKNAFLNNQIENVFKKEV